jgi:hypothetical protein
MDLYPWYYNTYLLAEARPKLPCESVQEALGPHLPVRRGRVLTCGSTPRYKLDLPPYRGDPKYDMWHIVHVISRTCLNVDVSIGLAMGHIYPTHLVSFAALPILAPRALH